MICTLWIIGLNLLLKQTKIDDGKLHWLNPPKWFSYNTDQNNIK
jgi:hypothetical protein